MFAVVRQLFAFLGMSATFGIGALLIGMAIVRDLKTALGSTNNNAIAEDQNRLQNLNHFHEFIDLHAKVKELSVAHSKTSMGQWQ